MKKYLVLAIAGIFSIAHTHAQGFLCGKIIDEEDSTPLYGASIYVSELKTGATADTAGNFKIQNVPSGSFLAEIHMFGYATVAVTLNTVNEHGEYYTCPTIRLVKTPAEYHPVIITGVSGTAERKRDPVPSTLQTREHMLQHGSTNAVAGLTELPGISVVSTGNAIAKPVIRGLGFNRVVVLRNGVRQEGQQWGDEHGTEIDEFEIDRVEIIKGPGSIMYGSDAMAGVINFLTPRTVAQGTIGGEYVGAYQTNGMLVGNSLMTDGNINGISWQVRGSHKLAGNYFTPVDGYVANSGFKEFDGSGFIGLNRKWGVAQFSFSTFNQEVGLPEGDRDSSGNFILPVLDDNGNEAEQSFTSEQLKGYDNSIGIPRQQINHHRLGLAASVYRKNAKLKFDFGYQQNTRREFGNILEPDEIEIGLQLTTLSFNSTYYSAEPENDGGQLVAGISLQQQNNINKGSEYIIPDYASSDAGAFVHYHYIVDEIYVAAGVRGDIRVLAVEELFLDSNGLPSTNEPDNAIKFAGLKRNFGSVSGIAGISYQPREELVFRFNISRGYRVPNIAELTSNGRHEGTFRYEAGNATLKPETSFQVDLGISLTTDHFNCEVSAFMNDIQNFIYLSKVNSVFGGDSIVDPADPAPLYTFLQGHGRLMGGEITTDLHPHPFDWLHFENSFSFVKGELVDQPDSMTNLPFIPPAKYQSEINAHLEKQFWLFSNSFFSISGAYYFAQNRIYSAYETETPTSGYFLLDAGAGTQLVNKKGTIVCRIYLSANNLLNTKYQSHLSRLKYAPENPVNGLRGIYGQGRNFSVRLVIPFQFAKQG